MADLLGFVGVGRMGGPMANRLLDAGYRLCVYFGRRGGELGAARHQRPGRLVRHVVDAQPIAGIEQAIGHGAAHAADADEA